MPDRLADVAREDPEAVRSVAEKAGSELETWLLQVLENVEGGHE